MCERSLCIGTFNCRRRYKMRGLSVCKASCPCDLGPSMVTGSSLAHHTHDMHSHTHTHTPSVQDAENFSNNLGHVPNMRWNLDKIAVTNTSRQHPDKKHFILQYALMTCQNVPEPNMMISIVHNVSSCFWPNQDRLGSHGAWRPCANHKNI